MLLLDQIERQVLADRQVAALVGADLPTFHEQRAMFDEALTAEPKVLEAVDSEQMELRRALGVA